MSSVTNRASQFASTTMAVLLTAIACQPSSTGSQSLGFNSDEMREAGLADLKPDFAALNAAASSRGEIKVSLYFAYDERQPTQLAMLDASRMTRDAGFKQFNNTADWLTKGGGETPAFLTNTKIEIDQTSAQPYRREITGDGPAPGGSGTVKWRFKLYLGNGIGTGNKEIFMKDFGQDLAESDITLYSGHIADPNEAAYDFERARSKLTQDFSAALASFQANAAANERSYRIVAFNGCSSEPIEDAILALAPQGIDMVTQRGTSNYKYFNAQISGFFQALSAGENWPVAIDRFKNLYSASSSAKEQRVPRSEPLFRNHQHGG